MLRRLFLAALFAAPLAGCLSSPVSETSQPVEYVGRWVEVLLGGDGDGFELFADGVAASIGQSELTYTRWRAKPGTLFLTTIDDAGKSVEVGYSAKVSDVTRLHLSQNDKDDWPRIFRMVD